MQVRARVRAWARDPDRAEELARQVEIRMEDGRLVADGPDTGRRESWAVSFDLQVPRQSDLRAPTFTGGIRVKALRRLPRAFRSG